MSWTNDSASDTLPVGSQLLAGWHCDSGLMVPSVVVILSAFVSADNLCKHTHTGRGAFACAIEHHSYIVVASSCLSCCRRRRAMLSRVGVVAVVVTYCCCYTLPTTHTHILPLQTLPSGRQQQVDPANLTSLIFAQDVRFSASSQRNRVVAIR